MRKILLLLAMFMGFSFLAFSQTRTVTGTVLDEAATPVPFASVSIKGTSVGVSADAEGNFTINAAEGAVLVFSATGYNTMEVTVSNGVANAVLKKGEGELIDEVVVTTAYGARNTKRSATSNIQSVSANQLTTIRQPNLNNALVGKVAGIQLRGQSAAALGRDGGIRLRGEGTLNGSGPLYIVDGTPTNANDINPDDVEDLTVLNGPTGAALYGPQAASGAIVVTLKKGRSNQKGIGLEINSGLTFDRVYNLPNFQNSYAGGGGSEMTLYTWKPGDPEEWKALNGKYYPDYTDDQSWGPRMAGQEYIPWYAWYPGTKYTGKTAALTPQPDNIRDFFNTGITANNNISFSKAGDNYRVRISYTNLDQKGLIPTTWLRKNTFVTNASIDLNKHFSVATNINYITQLLNAENSDGYGNNSSGSFNQWFHRDLDIGIIKELRGLKSPEGSTGAPGVLASWNHPGPGAYVAENPVSFYGGNYWYNPYSYLDNISFLSRRDRWFGNASLTYKVNDDLRFTGTFRKSQVTTWSENKVKSILETSATQTGLRAAYSTSETFFNDERFELVGSYDRKFSDFTTGTIAGGEIVKISDKRLDAATRDGLYIPDYFAINNSIGTPDYRTPGTTTVNPRSEERRRAIFFREALDWKKMIYGEFTLRNDWFSTLPANDNGIFTKSFGLGFVFSELTKNSLPWLSFGKLRGAWGETPSAINPYGLDLYYGVNADQWNSYFTMTTPNQIVSSNIKGSVRTTAEIGLDLQFLKNRLGISGTYYNNITKNSPVAVGIDGSSGFTTQLINAGEIQGKGFELKLNTKPLELGDFAWELNANYAYNLSNKVIDIAPGVNQIALIGGSGAGFSGITTPFVVHQKGEPWGMLIGGGKKFLNGKQVLDANGFNVKEDNVKFGSILPRYTGGIQNSFDYKGIMLNVNIDFQSGGKFFSLSDMFGSGSGLTARTAVLNDKGNPIRDEIADGGGIHMVGVDIDGNPVDKYVGARDYFQSLQNNNVFDEYIYDLTYVKMRELSLGYALPVQNWGTVKKWIQGAQLSLVARNPWIMYRKTKDFDPSEISGSYGENGQFPGTRSYGFNLRLSF